MQLTFNHWSAANAATAATACSTISVTRESANANVPACFAPSYVIRCSIGEWCCARFWPLIHRIRHRGKYLGSGTGMGDTLPEFGRLAARRYRGSRRDNRAQRHSPAPLEAVINTSERSHAAGLPTRNVPSRAGCSNTARLLCSDLANSDRTLLRIGAVLSQVFSLCPLLKLCRWGNRYRRNCLDADGLTCSSFAAPKPKQLWPPPRRDRGMHWEERLRAVRFR
jgi:hypothetical protein